MATRDSGGQSQSGRSRRDDEIDEAAPEVNPEVAERQEALTEDVDDLLDEIDSVLEENAEEFVEATCRRAASSHPGRPLTPAHRGPWPPGPGRDPTRTDRGVVRARRRRGRDRHGAGGRPPGGPRGRPAPGTVPPYPSGRALPGIRCLISGAVRPVPEHLSELTSDLRGSTWRAVSIHSGVSLRCSPWQVRRPSVSS